jgi:hypothetical protein
MTDRTWVGTGDDNSVYDAANWSPDGAPASGDLLFLLNGTADISGGDLSGDTIDMGFTNKFPPVTPVPASLSPVLNVSGGATVKVQTSGDFFTSTENRSTINVSGGNVSGGNNVDINSATSTHASGDSDFTVHIQHGTMTGSINLFNGQGTIDGPGTFRNINSSLDIGSMTIRSDMVGTGSTSLTFMRLDLDDRVSVDQTFILNPVSTLTIEHPRQFLGRVVATTTQGAPGSEIELMGIKADSYSLADGLLKLYAGHKVVDRLALRATSAQTFVWQGSSGVEIGLNGHPADVSLLPLHMACACT